MRTPLSFPAHTLALAFGLELAALASYGAWAWQEVSGPLRIPVVIVLPLLVAVLWGVFATAGAQVTGTTVVATPGPVRLLLEMVVLWGAVAALLQIGAGIAAAVMGTVLVVHLVLTRDRIRWLLAN